MVDTSVPATASAQRLALVSVRAPMGVASGLADVFAMIVAYLSAVALSTFAVSAAEMPEAQYAPVWSVAALLAVGLTVFFVLGLYELEAYVSRPLHLWTILKGSVLTFALSSPLIYVINSGAFDEFRIVFLATFAIFFVLTCVLRLGVLDVLCAMWMRQRAPVSLLVGDSDSTLALGARLSQLRGFDNVKRVIPAALGAEPEKVLDRLIDYGAASDSRVASLFVDAACMTPQEAFDVARAGQAMGAEVYVASHLLQSLESSRLLSTLFEAPVVRYRRAVLGANPYPLKRVFDIVGSGLLLLVCAPVMAVLAVIIKATSPGPVFYKQSRIGRNGAPFEFLKLRSMVVDGDECIHEDYVKAFMNGTAEAVANGDNGEAVFKRVDDPRITPIGRFIRKFSLDELPQFWNVFRGDMSLVGPRPPLPYEAEEYDDWDRLRLTVPPGITGLWQVEGRSRVSFNEMIFQDLMYAQNMRLSVDIALCLKTLPAALLGGGGG